MIGGLEGGDAVAFSSGMAACAAVLGAASGRRAPRASPRTATRAWPASPRRARATMAGASSACPCAGPSAGAKRVGTPTWSGSRRRPTRCSTSPTWRGSAPRRGERARARRRQHVRHAAAAASARAGRGRGRPLGHEVPRRPLRPADGRGGCHVTQRAARAAWHGPHSSTAPRRARWRPSWPPRRAHAAACGWKAAIATAVALAERLEAHPAVAARPLPGLRRGRELRAGRRADRRPRLRGASRSSGTPRASAAWTPR